MKAYTEAVEMAAIAVCKDHDNGLNHSWNVWQSFPVHVVSQIYGVSDVDFIESVQIRIEDVAIMSKQRRHEWLMTS